MDLVAGNNSSVAKGSLVGRNIVGKRDASGKRFGVVVSQFNSIYCERLLDGAISAITSVGGSKDDITVVRVPGSFELPLASKKLIQTGSVDAVVALGVLVNGETDHFEHVAAECGRGIMEVSLETGVPVTFGVIPAHTIQQVEARSQPPIDTDSNENRGFEAAMAAVQMVSVLDLIDAGGSKLGVVSNG